MASSNLGDSTRFRGSSISFTVLNVPGIVGVSIYAQALLPQDPFSLRLTNVTGDVIIQ